MALDVDVKRLAALPLLAELDLDALRLIAFSAETRILRAGDLLFTKGDASDGGFVVVSGAVALDPSDSGQAAAKIIGPDSLIGELALVTETTRPATAIARQPTVVLFISRKLFHRVLNEFPGGAARLRAAIESRLAAFADGSKRFGK